ncbi:hypothetical protein FRC17_001884 [Serendipita sp. 399]|nr:hypothetical protein FRC17_001884 [Serendipita sp. 399]
MENVRINLPVFSRLVTLDISDIQVYGVEWHTMHRRLSYTSASVAIVCFGIDNPLSLYDAANVWVPEIRWYAERSKLPILLVGCKKDVRADPEEIERRKKGAFVEPVSVEQYRIRGEKWRNK